ncbi:MAG: hypothetical protein NG784_15800 [Candidatus Jettenia sp.]|nr:hypothetical protein [Candidatus Jettenia sp.]
MNKRREKSSRYWTNIGPRVSTKTRDKGDIWRFKGACYSTCVDSKMVCSYCGQYIGAITTRKCASARLVLRKDADLSGGGDSACPVSEMRMVSPIRTLFIKHSE